MIVRFDLEGDGESITDRDDPGVLAGPLKDEGCLRGQRLEERSGVFVRAVLAPKCADDPQLGEGRLAAQHVDESPKLVRGQSVFCDECRRDEWIAGPRLDLRSSG